MELESIKLKTTWNDAAGSINSNFNKIRQAIVSTSGDKNYCHTQSVASADWVIEHDLGKYPSVTVVSSAGEVIYCDKTFISMNKIVLNFGTPISGTAFLN